MDYASKNCVLLFDEMDVQNVYSHNSRLQETISPAKKLLVVMVREVFENPLKSYLAFNKDCESHYSLTLTLYLININVSTFLKEVPLRIA